MRASDEAVCSRIPSTSHNVFIDLRLTLFTTGTIVNMTRENKELGRRASGVTLESQIAEIRLTIAFLLETTIYVQQELHQITVTQTAILSALSKKFPDLDREIKRSKGSVEQIMGKDHIEIIRLLRKAHAMWRPSKSRGRRS
jgi:hypothetical protein